MTQRKTCKKIKSIAKIVQKKLDGSYVSPESQKKLIPKSQRLTTNNNSPFKSRKISSYCTPSKGSPIKAKNVEELNYSDEDAVERSKN